MTENPQRSTYDLLTIQEDTESNSTGSLDAFQKPKHSMYRQITRARVPIFAAVALLVLTLMCFGIIHITIVILGRLTFIPNIEHTAPNLRNPDREHPTKNVTPIPCHSHNDYWRNVPLFDALSVGCTSVEADIWLVEGEDATELYVGHNKRSLDRSRTLRGLYLDPIADLLSRANSDNYNLTTPIGLFETAPGQTLVLLLDFKTDPENLLPRVQAQIEPLRTKDYLSYWDGGQFVSRPITLVATGNIPSSLIAPQHSGRRYLFVDAPLEQLWDSESTDELSVWNTSIAYYASTSFAKAIGKPWMGRLTSKQKETIRGQIREARKRGLKVRYWATPAWPVSLRNHIWQTLLDEGSDVLNVDDLYAAAFLDWNRVSHTWVNG